MVAAAAAGATCVAGAAADVAPGAVTRASFVRAPQPPRSTAKAAVTRGAGLQGPTLPRFLHARIFVAVVAEHRRLAVDDRAQSDRALPDAHQRAHGRARIVRAQIDSAVPVHHQQLAAVLEVRVLDEDERVALVRQLEQELLLHLLE